MYSPTGYWAHYAESRTFPVVSFLAKQPGLVPEAMVSTKSGLLIPALDIDGFIAVLPWSDSTEY